MVLQDNNSPYLRPSLIHDLHFSLQVIGIYGYTIFAIQQERFLDDFDMPEEIDRTKKD